MLRTGWKAALFLSLAWGILPALPALVHGQLLGHGRTDLFPSVWGLWWFVQQQPGLPTHCSLLGAPGGMPFYYSSPLHGWLAWPFLSWLGITNTWNLLTVLARVATVLCAYGAGRAWGLEKRGALIAAAVYGCSPFFHGYSVEGIVEGQDGWALALWAWAVGGRKRVAAALALGLCYWTSWYLGAAASVLAVLLGPRGWWSLAGILAAVPGLLAFSEAFATAAPLEPAIRHSMGSQVGFWTPGILGGLQPFAKSSWLGIAAPLLALTCWRQHRRAVFVLGLLWILSTGWGPWYALPPLSAIRFPYRFHAATLLVLGYLAARGAEGRRQWITALPIWIVLEGLLLSPIEPVLPGADPEIPDIYDRVRPGLVLDIPGPLAMQPGKENPSRPRARWLLYAQTVHGQQTPWVPDFNGVGVQSLEAPWLEAIRSLDPASGQEIPVNIVVPPEVTNVLVHRKGLGDREEDANLLLTGAGFLLVADDRERRLYQRP